MANSTPKSTYLRGILDGAPFVLVIIPFALLFGVVASEAGLRMTEVMGFSILLIAGAAQFTAVQLMTEDAPVVIILATALAVNLRMAMYSASITPYLGQAKLWQRAIAAYFLVDQSYMLAMTRFEARPEMTLSERLAYYFGVLSPVAPMWYISTYIGALLGAAIPPEFAIDFGLPITFIAMIAPALRSTAHVAAAVTSIVLALALGWMAYGTGLLVAAFAAMVVGAQVEQIMQRRRA